MVENSAGMLKVLGGFDLQHQREGNKKEKAKEKKNLFAVSSHSLEGRLARDHV